MKEKKKKVTNLNNSKRSDYKRYSEDDFNAILKVGLALSSQNDTTGIMNCIVEQAQSITESDGVSIYLIENIKQDSLGGARPQYKKMLRFHKTANNHVDWPQQNQFIDINENSLAGFVALTGKTLKIRDVYLINKETPYKFLKTFDKSTSYRTKSILAVPIITAKGKVLGVLQLINKLRKTAIGKRDTKLKEKDIIAFSNHDERLMKGFASQAAISLENAKLNQDINNLFESFVKASVTAIESRDPTTSGHSDRVADLTVSFAKTIDSIHSGPYEFIKFRQEQIKELRYASLLHDFGKIGVKENILLKSKKLFPHEMETISLRMKTLAAKSESNVWKETFQKLISSPEDLSLETIKTLMGEAYLEADQRKRNISNIEEKISLANSPQVIDSDFNIKKLLNWVDMHSQELGSTILTDEEKVRLSIGRGTLSPDERKEIELHVSHTYSFLKQIAWTEDLSYLPEIAHCHHEKLDGTGYPRGLKADEIPIQTRLMTICDIYDALTAMDRPYKRALPLERALQILTYEANDGKLDPALLDIFIESKVYEVVHSPNKKKQAA